MLKVVICTKKIPLSSTSENNIKYALTTSWKIHKPNKQLTKPQSDQKEKQNIKKKNFFFDNLIVGRGGIWTFEP